jgi:hypothetical protein
MAYRMFRETAYDVPAGTGPSDVVIPLETLSEWPEEIVKTIAARRFGVGQAAA